jgi:hypothetical protein
VHEILVPRLALEILLLGLLTQEILTQILVLGF